LTKPDSPESFQSAQRDLNQIVISPEDIQAAKGNDQRGLREQEELYTKQHQQKELDKLELANRDYANNIQARKVYAACLFSFLSVYMIVVMVIVFLQGFGKMKLEASVMNTLLVTVTANVFGVFNFVAKYLFHIDGQRDDKQVTQKKSQGNADTPPKRIAKKPARSPNTESESRTEE